MTRLESRQRGLIVVVAESARLKPASEASVHSELVIVVVVVVESARLKPASESSAHSELAIVVVVVVESARLKPASESSAHYELVIVVVVVVESARLKPASESSARYELVKVVGVVVVTVVGAVAAAVRSGPETARSGFQLRQALALTCVQSSQLEVDFHLGCGALCVCLGVGWQFTLSYLQNNCSLCLL